MDANTPEPPNARNQFLPSLYQWGYGVIFVFVVSVIGLVWAVLDAKQALGYVSGTLIAVCVILILMLYSYWKKLEPEPHRSFLRELLHSEEIFGAVPHLTLSDVLPTEREPEQIQSPASVVSADDVTRVSEKPLLYLPFEMHEPQIQEKQVNPAIEETELVKILEPCSQNSNGARQIGVVIQNVSGSRLQVKLRMKDVVAETAYSDRPFPAYKGPFATTGDSLVKALHHEERQPFYFVTQSLENREDVRFAISVPTATESIAQSYALEFTLIAVEHGGTSNFVFDEKRFALFLGDELDGALQLQAVGSAIMAEAARSDGVAKPEGMPERFQTIHNFLDPSFTCEKEIDGINYKVVRIGVDRESEQAVESETFSLGAVGYLPEYGQLELPSIRHTGLDSQAYFENGRMFVDIAMQAVDGSKDIILCHQRTPGYPKIDPRSPSLGLMFWLSTTGEDKIKSSQYFVVHVLENSEIMMRAIPYNT